MREVRFRAWYEKGGYMMPVEEIDFKQMLINKSGIWRWFGEVELMQYTGLKDKNGVYIYEGDIIEFVPFETSINNRIVKFERGVFKAELIRNGYSVTLSELQESEIEVIGNIYQNKDLI